MLVGWILDQLVWVTRGHAHNDYAHKRPLREALELGYRSIEVDVFLVNGEILVGHDRQDLVTTRTLDGLYLAPLYREWMRKSPLVPSGTPELTLLIDIKAEGTRVWDALQPLLRQYAAMLTTYKDGTVRQGAVRIVLSGDRPVSALRDLDPRSAFIDGRLVDLELNTSPSLVPLVSAPYRETLGTSSATLDRTSKEKLRSLVRTAHKQKRRIRFWGNPDTKQGWSTLYDSGVDLVNTDNLVGLRDFLAEQRPNRATSLFEWP